MNWATTYDHRLRNIGHPVRSAIHKLQIGEISSWVGDHQRIPAVVCPLVLFFFWLRLKWRKVFLGEDLWITTANHSTNTNTNTPFFFKEKERKNGEENVLGERKQLRDYFVWN
jgi:hypothetical protein